MQHQILGRGLAAYPRRPFRLAAPQRWNIVRAAVEQDTQVQEAGKASEKDVQAAQQSDEEIYIGFEKSDIAPRGGRKGRVVRGDPSLYPEKNEWTGGWSGGEIGLQQFIQEELQQGGEVKKAKVVESRQSSGKTKAKAVTADGQEIYLGFSKEDLEARKAGQKGRSIVDDPRKYPDKENFGVFPGVTGGFAGGEKGVRQFVDSGDIQIGDQGGKREFSPLLVAAVLAGGVTTGAILLNSGVLLSEQAFTGSLQGGGVAPTTTDAPGGFVLDANTRLLLNIALGLLGIGAAVIVARAFATRFQESTVRLRDDAVNLGKIAAFWIAVLVAALYIVDSQ